MATVQRYVNTASTGGDGTTNGTSGASAAYASLASWETNSGGSATDDYVVDCCGTSADTTAVTVDFAVNITTGSVTIRGNTGDGAGKYNGTSVISTSHYRLVPASGNCLDLRENKVTVDGIQIEAAGGAFFNGIQLANIPSSGGNFTIQNNRIRAASATDNGIGCGGSAASWGTTCTIRNNLIVGFNTNQIEVVMGAFFAPTVNIYQNTCYGDGSAVGIKMYQPSNGAMTVNCKGNAIGNSGASNCFSTSLSGTATINYDDNATEDAQGTTGEIAIGTLSNAWTSPGTTQGSVFTVKNTSSSLYNAVNPTLVTTDITGFTRDGTNHDVGAFEYQSSGLSINATLGTASASGFTATVNRQRNITASLGTAAALGFTANVNRSLQLAATYSPAVASGFTANVNLQRNIIASLGTAAAIGYQATFGSVLTINATCGTAVASGYQAQVDRELHVTANLGVATALGRRATVTLGTSTSVSFPDFLIDLETGKIFKPIWLSS
jgi:hypothetical protein